ncbi:GNAT family N-acetyltransferase [bacterium]|nr:GNAT family N-acetyltransferase [bacterium]
MWKGIFNFDVALVALACPSCVVRPFQKGDENSLVASLNDRDEKGYKASHYLTHIPENYTVVHAREWISRVQKEYGSDIKTRLDWAVDIGGEVAGSVSLINLNISEAHKAQISFWLSPRFRGRGIMTEAVRAVVDHVFKNAWFVRIHAWINEEHDEPAHVLRRVGFTEGVDRHDAEWFRNGDFPPPSKMLWIVSEDAKCIWRERWRAEHGGAR